MGDMSGAGPVSRGAHISRRKILAVGALGVAAGLAAATGASARTPSPSDRIGTEAVMGTDPQINTEAVMSTEPQIGIPATSRPTIVLVHGAFAESASFNGVIARLQDRGYTAVAAANPLRGIAGDAAYVASILRSIEGPIVLAGHSYGGAVISGAAVGNDNVKALVYLSGFAAEEGETLGALNGKFPGSTLTDTLMSIPLGDGSNDLYIQQDKFHDQFEADVSIGQASLDAATQRPIRDSAFTEPVTAAAWKTIPSWFGFAELDKNIPVATHRFMAQRAQAREVVEVKGASHSFAVAQPNIAAGLILRAAKYVERLPKQ